MRRTIIGLCGPAKSGKSLAAQYLANEYGFERVRFAGPLKAMLAALGLSPDEIDGDLKEQPSALLGGQTPRHAMITLGTEWGRQLIDPDLWINAWRLAVDRLPPGVPVVVEDCRFANEAGEIRLLGGLTVRLDRRGAGIGVNHESEAANFTPDGAIDNNDTPEALCDKLDQFVARASLNKHTR
jgi:hypothetical protein